MKGKRKRKRKNNGFPIVFIFFVEFCIFCEFLMIFFRISRQIPEKSDVCRFSIKFAETNSKIAEIFEICENYSILFNRVLSGLAVRDRAEVVDGGHDRWVLRVLPVDLTLHVQRQAEVPGLQVRNSRSELAKLAKFCKFLAGSFSAVSKRFFARKYAFDSIFQALQDLHPFAPLQSQKFRKKFGLKKQQFS